MSSKSKEFPDKVLQRFREMADNEFYEFFYQLARERRKKPERGGEPEVRIVVAAAARDKANEHAEPEPWRFSFIATAAPQYEKWNLSSGG